MSVTAKMLATRPVAVGQADREALVSCLDQVLECAQACTVCADACLAEEQVAELRRCIRTDLNCADVCHATARVLSRFTGEDADLVRDVLETCATVCLACGAECERHASMHEHCAVCAEACRNCADACQALLATLA
ncbi:four-helix bundle copper-binding protein [Streptomyces sp. Ru73]|uniref:four-helix bundle copper-binding protein n=1 Tax=Streptomyces sp. Ru73 TaxID=2080748 RepID=UPI000CDDA572|nr:four-helix bundle copper-binding protein [Streptomyces sp. Ru73]POX38599.1 four-helix bundle copper-binding protein [Streptomyces sp. Ru73]